MNDRKITVDELSKLIGVSLNTFNPEHVKKWINRTVEKYPEYKNDFSDVYDCIELINNPKETTVVARVLAKYGKKLNLTQAFTKSFDNKLLLLGDSEIWYPLFKEVRRNSKAQSIIQVLTYLEKNNGDIISLLEKEDEVDYYRVFISKDVSRLNKEFIYKHGSKFSLSSNQNDFKEYLKLLAMIKPEEAKMNLLIALHKKTSNPYIKNEIVNQIEEHCETLLALSPIRKKTLESMFNVKNKVVYHGEIELDIAILNEYVDKTQEQMKEILSNVLYKICKEIKRVVGLDNYGGIDCRLRYQSEDALKIQKINLVTDQIKNNLDYLIQGMNDSKDNDELKKFMDNFLVYVNLEKAVNDNFSNKAPNKTKLKI